MNATDTPQNPPDPRPPTGRWGRLTAILANSSLRTVLVATFSALMIGAVGTVGLLSYQAGQQAVTTLANQLMAEIGDRIDQRLARSLSGLRHVVDSNAALIRQGRLGAGDTAALEQHFATQLGLFPDLDSIGLVTEGRELLMLARQAPDALMIRRFDAATGYRLHHYRADLDGQPGELIESRDNYDPHNDPPGKPWYPAVRAAGQGSWRLSISLAKGQDRPVMVHFYALPFDDIAGKPQGVLVAGMTLTGMSEFLRGLQVSANGQAFLVDREGLLIATSTDETPFDSRARTDHAHNVAVETRRLAAVASTDPLTRRTARELLALQPSLQQLGTPLSFEFDFNGQHYLAKVVASARVFNHPDWLTVVVAPQQDFTALITAHLRQPLLLAGLVLSIAVMLGLVAADSISRSLGQLNAATRRLAAGDFDQPLPHAPIRELRELGASFGKMTQRLREAFAELRDLNHALRIAERDLAEHNRHLEQRVAERTAEVVAAQDRVAQALVQISESEAKFRAMFEQSPLGIVLVEPLTGRILEVNERLFQIIGRTREDLSAHDWTGITHPEDLPAEIDQVNRLRAGTIDGYQIEKRYLSADGSVVWGDLTVVSVTMAADTPHLHLCLVEDITARKRAEGALRESEERFRLAFDNANTGMSLVDLQGRLLQVNDKMSAIFGYSRQELAGMTVNDLTLPDDQAVSPAFIDHAIHGNGDSATFEKRYRHRQGHIIYGQVASSLVRDARGQPQYFISQVQDISERIRYEQELQRARDAAESASRAKGEFLAHMSHEIRTPLNVVLGLAQVLNRGRLDTQQRDMIGRIQTAGHALLAILNDILDLSKIEAGRLRIEPHPFDLGTLLARLDDLMGQAARAKGLVFRVESIPAPLGPLVGDALRLEQVLVNLIGNAVKFTEQGQVTLAVGVLQADATTARLRCAVRDTGIGIPPEALERLFTPFTQAEEGITRRFGGTGLGLAISKRLLALMGGDMGVESQVGQGSTFWFELPLARAAADDTALPVAAPAVSPAPLPTGPRLTGLHLLVVDDSAMNRDLVERALALEGASVTLAADGQQAIDALATWPSAFDAVLMDVRMPVMDGLTATRLIRHDLGLTDLPVIALTAGVLAAEQEAARAAGIDDILAKPMDLEQMTTLLLKWVEPMPSATDASAEAGAAAGPGQATTAAGSITDHDPSGEFPDIAGIDRTWAAETMSNNRDLFLRLLKGFASEYADAADRTARELTQGALDSAARRMHNLRGGAGQLGALDLMALAKALEEAIDRGETDLEDRLAVLDRQLADLMAAMTPWLEVLPAGPEAPDEVSPLDADRLAALRWDLSRCNLKARRRFEELRPALAGALGASRTEVIGRAIRDLHFKEALAALDEATASGSNHKPIEENRS